MSKKPIRQNNAGKAASSVKNAKKPPRNAGVKTVKTIDGRQMVETIVVNVLLLFVFLAFGYIAVMSFFQTSVIDPQKYINEKILFQGDMVVLNLLLTALFTAFLFFLRRYYDFFAKVNIRAMEIAMTSLVIFAGLVWVLTVRSVPAADSYNLFEAASDAANGKYTSMQNYTQFYNSAFYNGYSYFHFYPFQLGFVAFSELIYRIFGADSMWIQVINVLCVGASYLALARITKLLFKRKSVEFIAILLLAGCLQPVLFCTFVYGNIIGMCCAIWASLFLIKYFQTGQYRWIYPSGALLVFSTLVKYNNLIYLVAFVIVLLVHIVKAKKWQSAVIKMAERRHSRCADRGDARLQRAGDQALRNALRHRFCRGRFADALSRYGSARVLHGARLVRHHRQGHLHQLLSDAEIHRRPQRLHRQCQRKGAAGHRHASACARQDRLCG